MQATFARALLVLLACTSATHAMPNLIQVRADNSVNQANAPTEAQMAEAQAHADQFLSIHQADTAAFADSLNKAQEAAKANGKDLDISGLFKGLDLSGINLKDLNISTDAPAKADDSKADDSKAADPAKPPAWPFSGTGYYAGYYSSYYCYYCPYYPQYCAYCNGGSGPGYNYLCSIYPQYCGGGTYPDFPDYYPNPFGIKPYDGKTSCGDLGTKDAKTPGFICNDAADTISYCTVTPEGSYTYQKCSKKGSCGCKDDGSFCLCTRG